MDHEKMTPKDATYQAMKDISGPVIAIALILAAVFVPVGFIPGIVGRLYQQFAITIAISVLISAFIALSLTPALCTLILRPSDLGSHSKGLNKFFYKFNIWFAHVTSRYSLGVKKSIRLGRYVAIILLCIMIGTLLLFRNKPTGFIPIEDDGRLYITFDLPESSSTERTVTVLHEIMQQLDSVKGIAHYAALGGLNVVSFATKSNSATIFCQLKPWDERKSKALQIGAISAEIQGKLRHWKEASSVVIQPPAIPGLGSTAGFSFILEQKSGSSDIKAFEAVLQKFTGAINQRPEIGRAFSFFTARTPGYQLEIDREKAKKMGVQISAIATALQTYLGSSYVNDFTIYGRNFRVLTQADSTYRGDIKDLGQYFVRNTNGDMVPLNVLTSYKVIESAPVVSHYNLFRSAEINGSPAPGYSSGDAINALKEVAAEVLPEGYGYEFSGLSREELLSGSKTIYIFALSIIFVFLFLAALYESWSVPFSVLLAVPLGAFGAILTLTFLPSLNNNVYAQIGLITLIGLSAKNAILIVEYAKERVDRGMELVTATVEAAKLRLRPIIMTSLAFLLGILPLVLATGAGAESRKTMGWTVLGGMFTATFLAIFVVPVLYVLVTRLAYGKEKLKAMQENYKSMQHTDI
jgi:HAE1 family hydrophobic/amphiphilic exporter-1